MLCIACMYVCAHMCECMCVQRHRKCLGPTWLMFFRMRHSKTVPLVPDGSPVKVKIQLQEYHPSTWPIALLLGGKSDTQMVSEWLAGLGQVYVG